MAGVYTVVCECGRPYSVTSYESGDERICSSCQRRFKIPLILKTTQQVIQRMIEMRRLPSNDLCPFSNSPADSTVSLLVEVVPRQHNPMVRAIVHLVGSILDTSPMLSARVANEISEQQETSDQGVIAIVPLGVSRRVQEKLPSLSHEKLRTALRVVPVYAHLLDEFDHVRVSVLTVENE